MNGFVVAVKKPTPTPPVTKAGLKEYLLEYIVDSDLVWYIFHYQDVSLSNVLISVFSLCRAFIIPAPHQLPLPKAQHK